MPFRTMNLTSLGADSRSRGNCARKVARRAGASDAQPRSPSIKTKVERAFLILSALGSGLPSGSEVVLHREGGPQDVQRLTRLSLVHPLARDIHGNDEPARSEVAQLRHGGVDLWLELIASLGLVRETVSEKKRQRGMQPATQRD